MEFNVATLLLAVAIGLLPVGILVTWLKHRDERDGQFTCPKCGRKSNHPLHCLIDDTPVTLCWTCGRKLYEEETPC